MNMKVWSILKTYWCLIFLVSLFAVLSSSTALALEMSVTAPSESVVGAAVDINFEGEINPRNFLTIVSPDLPEGKYSAYQYTRRKTVKLTAPIEPGDYEIRLLDATSPFATLWRQALTVIDTVATIEAPESVNGGEEFALVWSGPDNAQDFITIVAADAPEGKYEKGYRYTKKGSPLRIIAPETAGVYELRYLMGTPPHRTLGRRSLTVRGITASVTVAAEIAAGAQFAVTWAGPDNLQDFLTIVPAGTPQKEFGNYAYTKKGNPAALLAPEQPGSYEVRYLTGQSYTMLASVPLELLPVSASVSGPLSVEARSVAVVTWQGPDNPQDYVIILPKGADNRTTGHFAYTARGSKLRIQTPDEPGQYEFRYLTARKRLTLATQAVTVIPRPIPGRLQVVASELQANDTDGAAVVVILDASGSMLQRIGERRRIDMAKEAVVQLVQHDLAPDVRFSLRVFGHKEKDACRTDVEIPLGPLNRSAAMATVASVNAMNLAKTPIAATLADVGADLADAPGQHMVILLTDGEETCDGDPAAVIQSLVDGGFDVRLNIVGFAIDELMLKETFQAWARLGNGQYFDAHNAEELATGLSQAIDVPFQVIGENDDVVAEGTVNGPVIELAAGEYVVRTAILESEREVSVLADQLTVISLEEKEVNRLD